MRFDNFLDYSLDTDPRPGFWQNRQFVLFLLMFQVLFIILFGVFGRYAPEAMPVTTENVESASTLNKFYPMFQDIHVMIFVGFGFLMTFLKKYGFSAVGINFLFAAFIIQWSLLIRGFFDLHHGKIPIGIFQLISADFSAAVVLISMGALLGKLSPIQYLIMGIIETVFAVINEHVLFTVFLVNDIGGSMVIHAFGAYFGLAVARVLARKDEHDHPNEGSLYHSDIFAMIGTIFLWLYWPSFNAGPAEPMDARERAVVNTYLSLAACCIVSFLVSALVDPRGRFTMVHIQNATLAGGVAVGTTANLILEPLGALIIGSIAGLLSVIGYTYLTPFLSSVLKIHDTCGVNNLHGMPGILAAVVGVIVPVASNPSIYGQSLGTVLPRMNPNGPASTAEEQAAYQLAGLGTTLAIAILGGILTGLILKINIWNRVGRNSLFDDSKYWEVPEDFVSV